MTPEEFKVLMEKIAAGDKDGFHDQVEEHSDADQLLCEVLRSLGYGDGVEIFKNMPKWYS